MEIYVATYETVWGKGALAATREGLRYLVIPRSEEMAAIEEVQTLFGGGNLAFGDIAYLPTLIDKLHRYFAGEVVDFTDVPLDWSNAAPFHSRVWEVVFHIPYGETRSYGEVAAMASAPRAARAVGQAMARNPIPVIVPCHRVVGGNGHLTGFGGLTGLPTKKRLLEMEGVKIEGMRVGAERE